MEYLGRLLRQLPAKAGFHCHPKCKRTNLTFLAYADDLFIFCKADHGSLAAIRSSLDAFSSISGLHVNGSKSQAFFGGVSSVEAMHLASMIGFQVGELPVRYLGIPLDSTSIKASHCVALLDMIASKIKAWEARFLSYAGKVILIRSVLSSLQVFWCRVFALPSKVLHRIDALCRQFLWSAPRKSPLSWDKICLPKTAGGLGIKSAVHINTSVILRQFWDLAQPTDSVWNKWIKSYVLKQNSIWDFECKASTPWTVKKIVRMKSLAESCCSHSNEAELVWTAAGQPFSSKAAYALLLPPKPKPPWINLVWSQLNYPKHAFILWLACHWRLSTKSRLHRLRLCDSDVCGICGLEAEDVSHVFLKCPSSSRILPRAIDFCLSGASVPAFHSWSQLMQWVSDYVCNAKLVRLALHSHVAAAVYHIWKARNDFVFSGKPVNEQRIWKAIREDCSLKLGSIRSVKHSPSTIAWCRQMNLLHLC